MIRDTIKPDLTMFIHYETLEYEGKFILCVDIQQGSKRPYYVAKKGLRPEGVYVRQGYSSVPASDTAIRKMIKETDGDHFEDMRSLEQDLTFIETEKEFNHRDIDFGMKQMQTLKIINQDNLYTNLGLLLSEQCVHTIKVAVFQGTDQSVFKDRREFGGSLIQQLHEVYDYMDRYNQTRATFQELLRIDTQDYPKVAIREALLNILIHRDYGFSASSLISLYDDRMEFVSIGGLLLGVNLEDVTMGLSVCRNQNLANVFYRLRLIEAYGTGLQKIMNAYKPNINKPIFKCTNNAFKIVLPNMNAEYNTVEQINNKKDESQNEKKVLVFIKQKGWITRCDVEEILGISPSSALRFIKNMVEKGMLIKQGKGKDVKYILKH
nr:ATP-binding protein [Absiella sp. AM54-8XD]